MQLTTIMAFLIPVAVATHHHKTLLKNILNSKGNFFTKVNKDVKHIMNNLFGALDLTTTFLEKSRVQLLLTMHYDLTNVAEKNFDVYEKMRNVSEYDHNQTTNKVELFDLIEEILNDKHLNLSGRIKENPAVVQLKHDKHTTKGNNTNTELGDSKEFSNFIEAFVDKVDKLSAKDFTRKTPIFQQIEITRNNLKVWVPPTVIELDFVNDTVNRRLFRGSKTRIVDFPFIVSVHVMGVFSCAGTIISSDLVITAASCLQLLHNNRFYRENVRDLYVRVGSDYFVVGGEVIDILEIYFHPSYEPRTLKNNLVILRLERLINFAKKKKKARRILYDRIPTRLPANTDVILTLGWGSRKRNQVIDEFQILRLAKLDIYQFDECADIYSKSWVTETNFCAGFISKGGGACNKDLGGPGIVGGKLVGIISFGAPVCGAADAPTVFTKVGYYATWIDSIERMRPPKVYTKTTPKPTVRPRVPVYTEKDEDPILPINNAEYEAPQTAKPEEPEEPEDTEDTEDLETELRTVLKELAEYNNSFLHDFLYPDINDDFHEMFQPTEKMNPLEHPLVNKSLFLIPNVHTFKTSPTNYVTLPLTTSSTILPPATTETTSTTQSTEPTYAEPVTTDPIYITDIARTQATPSLQITNEEYYYDNSDNYEATSTNKPTYQSDEKETLPMTYSSYEDQVAINKRHKHYKGKRQKRPTRPTTEFPSAENYIANYDSEYTSENMFDDDDSSYESHLSIL